jgi:hypothetical protein
MRAPRAPRRTSIGRSRASGLSSPGSSSGTGRGSLRDRRANYVRVKHTEWDDLWLAPARKGLTPRKLLVIVTLASRAGFRPDRMSVVLGNHTELADTPSASAGRLSSRPAPRPRTVKSASAHRQDSADSGRCGRASATRGERLCVWHGGDTNRCGIAIVQPGSK